MCVLTCVEHMFLCIKHYWQNKKLWTLFKVGALYNYMRVMEHVENINLCNRPNILAFSCLV